MNQFFEPFQAIRALSTFEILIRIAFSAVLGGIVGMEREINNKAAGLRTYMLVSLGATVVMMTNQYIFQVFGLGDPVRMGAQVISGIGFLGAGTIMVTAKNQIKGLTTAASLWAAAANGLAVGIGAYELAALGGLTLFLTLEFVHHLDSVIRTRSRVFEFYIELNTSKNLDDLVNYLKHKKIKVTHIEYVYDSNRFEDLQPMILTIPANSLYPLEAIIEIISAVEGVKYVERLVQV